MLNNFPGRQSDEQILMVIRKHPIVFVHNILIFLVAAIVPLSLFLSLWSRRFPLLEGEILGTIGYLGASFYLLYSLALLVISFLNDEFDLFILTSHRLIDITQTSFFKRSVATTPLNQIQDTTSDVSGFLGTLMNFGTVDVQTAAGLASNFTIDHVPNPGMIARAILDAAEAHKERDMLRRGRSPEAEDKRPSDLD